MNNRKYACGVTTSSINLIAELQDETDQSFLHEIDTDGKNDEIKIDQVRAKYLKNRGSDLQKARTESFQQIKVDANQKITNKDLDEANDLFLKPNSGELGYFDNSKDQIKMSSTPVRGPFENKNENFENLSYGSQTVKDFAKKLSKRLKILKPIK